MKRPGAWKRAVGIPIVLTGEVALASVVGGSLSTVGLVAVATVGALVVLVAPWLLPVLVVPGVWMLRRVGPSSLDMSMSDALLVVGLLAALWSVPWREPRLRRALVLVAAYLGLLAIAVAAHPSERAVVEWAHRAYLVGGSIAVGAAIAARDRVTLALRMLLAVAVVFGARAIIDAVSSGFDPAYPFGMQKNAAGGLLVMVLVALIVAPHAVRLSVTVRLAAMAVLLCGLLATQSRGAAIALVVISLGLGLPRGRRASLRAGAVVSALLAVGLVYATFDDIGVADKDNRFNSYNSRRLTNEYALEQWRESPITGIGVRFFRDPAFYADARAAGETTFGEPHNVIVANLAESGVVGLSALVLLVGGLIVVVRRPGDELAGLAVALLVTRFVNTQFDIWWVAGTLTLPFVVVGMAVARSGAGVGPVEAPSGASPVVLRA